MKRRNGFNFNKVAIVVAIVLAVASLTALLLLFPSATFADGDPKVTVTTARYIDIGFVRSTEPGRHFWGWPMVYAGQYGSANYYGLIGIELNVIPAGERIEAAAVTLGGVSTKWVGDNTVFRAELLSPAMSYLWHQYGYWNFHYAVPVGTIAEITGEELEDGGALVLEFPEELLPEVERAVARASQPRGHPHWLLPIRLSLVSPSEGNHLLELTSGDREPYHAVVLRITWTSAPEPRPPTPTPMPPPQ